MTRYVSGGNDQKVVQILEARKMRSEADSMMGHGGGEPPDEMNARIEKLEAGHKAILAKLDEIGKAIGDGRQENERRLAAVETKLAVIDTKLDGKATDAKVTGLEAKVQNVRDAIDTRASQADLNLLKGRVGELPTTIQLMLAVVTIFVAAGIARWFGH